MPPFHHVARHLAQPVPIGRERPHRRQVRLRPVVVGGMVPARGTRVVTKRRIAVVVGLRMLDVISPWKTQTCGSAARRILPLRDRRQPISRRRGIDRNRVHPPRLVHLREHPVGIVHRSAPLHLRPRVAPLHAIVPAHHLYRKARPPRLRRPRIVEVVSMLRPPVVGTRPLVQGNLRRIHVERRHRQAVGIKILVRPRIRPPRHQHHPVRRPGRPKPRPLRRPHVHHPLHVRLVDPMPRRIALRIRECPVVVRPPRRQRRVRQPRPLRVPHVHHPLRVGRVEPIPVPRGALVRPRIIHVHPSRRSKRRRRLNQRRHQPQARQPLFHRFSAPCFLAIFKISPHRFRAVENPSHSGF